MTLCHCICCMLLGEAQRECALKLVSLIVTAHGIEWLAAGSDEPSLLLLLAVRLSCIEVQMMLEEQHYASVSSNIFFQVNFCKTNATHLVLHTLPAMCVVKMHIIAYCCHLLAMCQQYTWPDGDLLKHM